MRDLRRRALESHKTVSKKTASRIASGASSKAPSAAASPAQSRAASRTRGRPISDDDEGEVSDGTVFSTNSIDDILNGSDDAEVAEAVWKAELSTRIEQISSLKRSTKEGRTESLTAYANIISARYAKDEIASHIGELLPSMIKSVRQETTDYEAIAALKAIAATVITIDSDLIYDDVADQLKRSIQSSESTEIKANAIHTLGISAFFGGADEGEMLDLMTLFVEIIESDGASVEAHDAGNVVTAALEEWGLLATRVEDLQEESEPAMEAFVEQLESADAGVQVAAGENIALLYEKSYTHIESDEEVSDADVDSDDPEADKEKSKFVKRYQVYRREDQLLHTLETLSDVSNRRISKKDRKTLHSSFADIHRSVEKPTRGPGYSTAIDQETGRVYGGGRMKLRLDREFAIIIDKWWKLHTLNALKRTLRGGVLQHCTENEAVESLLPVSAVSMRDRRG